ncbi:HIT family hydrolase [Rhizobium sp. Leaf384]|uniref:HIT family protein n=1 Tax=unclassified Rhizobium TaxID=2613769 RepID=UPI000713CBC2|nr:MULTISPECIES: HIT family protein [unclassified Rhizobium]KQS79234.1 HIT family hydrolase [Rhizobium sp. Leaf384]KQS82802.1 HIT family hydrolase [Rhizobium sp. Leaf383]
MTGYDTSNIFAKILRGEIPAHTVYEDEAVIAFMDVMPQADGHALVVPKAPSRNLLDADPATLPALIAAVQKVAIASKTAFSADGITILQFNEAPAGQSVFHLHVHVIPRHDGQPMRAHSGTMEDPDILKANAERLRNALKRVA